MALPFYYSFKEFTDNYPADFKAWLKEHPGKDEIDYLGWIYSLAGHYTGYGEFDNPHQKYTLTDMSIGADGVTYEFDISNYVSIFTGVVENNFREKFNLRNDNQFTEFIYNFDGNFKDFCRDKRFRFDNVIYELIPFFFIDKERSTAREVYDENNNSLKDEEGKTVYEEGDFPTGIIMFDYEGYKIFLNEMKLINEFILGKIAPEMQEEKEIKSNLTTPEKIVLLEHLGVFTKLFKDGVSPENEYKIIHNLIGGSYTNIKKYCLNRKTNNKSSKDYQINEKHKNTIKNFYNSKTY